MKALLLNGSPRMGNTYAALGAVAEGFKNIKDMEVETVAVADMSISPCMACDACKGGEGCVIEDDGIELVQKMLDADVIVFGTPVYWWGVTAQLKLLIDRMYAHSDKFAKGGKQIGLIAIGEAGVASKQYKIISDQFECIAEYLNWDIVFNEAISAADCDDLIKDTAKMAELKDEWKKIK